MADEPYAVEVKTFPEVRAVDGLSFRVAKGEIFGLVGPDGAGKTTTMRVLAGVMPPEEGSVMVCGCDVVRDPDAVKRHISYTSASLPAPAPTTTAPESIPTLAASLGRAWPDRGKVC
jgi:ABC-type multidrug transport system ATPase subunit